MRKAENMNAPNLAGWAIAAAAGLVAFGVLVIVGEFDLFPAGAMAGGVAAIAGLILGMPWGAEAPTRMAATAHAPANPAPAPMAEAMPAAFVATPAAAPAAVPSAGPMRMSGPRGGKADNLKEIEGIGPAMEKLVNEMGFYHFDQIASWSDADVAVVDGEMKSFKGRITRDKWVAQAKIIVTEGLEAFRERAKTNNY
jgi:predicted flap endonuclease-1-like 5' DNA nuclease